MTEFLVVPTDRLIAAEGVPPKYLSLVEPLTVGFHSVSRGRVTSSDTVAILGCGGVGLGAVTGAAVRGATVIGIDVDDDKLALARRSGAMHTIHSERENIAERMAELTGGLGPDVVIEAIGTPDTFRTAVEIVAWTGRVVYIGYAKEPVSYETRWFVQKEIDILGSRNALPEDFAAVVAALREGHFPVEDAISHRVPFESAGDAFAGWSATPADYKKILVEVAN